MRSTTTDDLLHRCLSLALGGKERFKNMVEHFLVHSAAVIAHGKQDKLAGNKTGMLGAIRIIKGHIVRLDDYFAQVGDGLPGIDTKIGRI